MTSEQVARRIDKYVAGASGHSQQHDNLKYDEYINRTQKKRI